MKEALLSAKEIVKTYPDRQEPILNRISIEIYQGDFTIIMGPSGAGKSTLLYALSGMDTLSSGKVLYRDQELGTLSEKRMASLRAREFGFVFQQTYLVSNLTLFENVAVAGYLEKGKTDKEVREQAESLLARMHVESAKDRLPAKLPEASPRGRPLPERWLTGRDCCLRTNPLVRLTGEIAKKSWSCLLP